MGFGLGSIGKGLGKIGGASGFFGGADEHQQKYLKKAIKQIDKAGAAIKPGYEDILGKALFEQNQTLGAIGTGYGQAIGQARDSMAGARQQAGTAYQKGLGQAQSQLASTGAGFGGSVSTSLQRSFLSDYQRRLTDIGAVLSGQTSALRAQQANAEASVYGKAPRTGLGQQQLDAMIRNFYKKADTFTGVRQEGNAPNAQQEMLQFGLDLAGSGK
jgi:hypothetical protein